MVSVTGTVTAVPPVGVMVTLPVKVPADKTLVFTVTTTFSGVEYALPLTVLNCIQLMPLLVVAEAVKVAPLDPSALDTVRYCVAGATPTAEAVKVRVGDVDVPPFAVTETALLELVVPTTKVTGTVCVPLFEVKMTLPV
jgi:hypothetical protein